MFILLIESDPIVRIDLCEALEAVFPDAHVKCAEDLNSVSSFAVQARLIILDTYCSEILECRMAQCWIENNASVVLTNVSGMTDCVIPNSWVTLQRPFNEQMLLEALKVPA